MISLSSILLLLTSLHYVLKISTINSYKTSQINPIEYIIAKIDFLILSLVGLIWFAYPKYMLKRVNKYINLIYIYLKNLK